MIKKCNKYLIIWILIIPVFLTGCWDYNDVSDRSLVVSVGVDLIGDKIELSNEVAKLSPKIGQSGGEAKISNVYTDLSYGENFEESRLDFDVRRPYKTFLGATRVVIFGSNYAKQGIDPYLNRINKIYDYRKTLLAVISREPVVEIFNVNVQNDISAGFLIENNINYLSKEGKALYTEIGQMLSNIAMGDVGYVVPYVGIEHGNLKYLGIAVMKESKLIGVIDIKDTDGLLYILSTKPKLVENIKSPKNKENRISFSTAVKHKSIKTDYKDGKVNINIDLDLKAKLRYQYLNETITKKDVKNLEDMLSKKIKNDIVNIAKKTQKDYKCDIWGFAKYFRADNPKVYEEIDWMKEYPKANITVNVNTVIVNQNFTKYEAKSK